MDFLAYAMGGGGASGGQGSAFGAFVPLILMFAIFYFLLIRPQQKKAKMHKEMIAAVKKGDKIISNGGLHGVVTGISDDTLTIEVAPKIRVKIARGFISSVIQKSQ
ncbi:MAG TPA: preprotein translocase subunit YajC [Desulfobacteraceae bacterium]|jgi:preprotein translocase subunit YajC|nr:preprotein translocase subunit YajC [Desulfobacteraceae bacterium]